MSHARYQIKKAAYRAIKDLPYIKGRVFISRVYKLNEEDTAAVAIYSSNESSERMAMGGTYQREMDLSFEIMTKGDDYDEAGDEIAKNIENAISVASLDNLPKDVTLISTEQDGTGEGNMPAAALTLTYRVLYITRDPETTL